MSSCVQPRSRPYHLPARQRLVTGQPPAGAQRRGGAGAGTRLRLFPLQLGDAELQRRARHLQHEVSLFLIRVDNRSGSAGILIAVLCQDLRITVAQVRGIERGNRLQRDRSEPQAIVWAGALRGIGAAADRRSDRRTAATFDVAADRFQVRNARHGSRHRHAARAWGETG